jgi:DNA (cytosine-5)-methyltransferase 1
MLRAIREIQPRWVVGENVLGLVNWSGGLVFHEVQADLEAEGYEVWPYVLPAASVGAPHRRDRVWFVAHFTNTDNKSKQQESRNRKWESSKQEQNDRDKVRNNASSICSYGSTPHPNGNGFNGSNCEHEEQPGKGGEYALSNAYTCDEYGDVADTGHTGLQGGKVNGSIGGIREKSDKFTTGCVRSNWQNFPTQSPICTPNDGLSSQLDGITFSKWRNESIKAAGNAIVPQVVYQIFKAIQQYETTPPLETTL